MGPNLLVPLCSLCAALVTAAGATPLATPPTTGTLGSQDAVHREDEYDTIMDRLYWQAREESIRKALYEDGAKDNDLEAFKRINAVVKEYVAAGGAQLVDDERRVADPPANPKGDDCAICLEALVPEFCMALPCGHYYHPTCIKELIKKRLRKCPLCSAKFLASQVYRKEFTAEQLQSLKPLRRLPKP